MKKHLAKEDMQMVSMLVSFLSLWQITREAIKRGKMYFGSCIESMVMQLCCFWVCGEVDLHNEELMVGQCSSPHDSLGGKEWGGRWACKRVHM